MLTKIVFSKHKRCKSVQTLVETIKSHPSSTSLSQLLEPSPSFSLPELSDSSSSLPVLSSDSSSSSSLSSYSSPSSTDDLILSNLLCQWRNPDFPFVPNYPSYFSAKNQLFFDVHYPGIHWKPKEIKFIS